MMVQTAAFMAQKGSLQKNHLLLNIAFDDDSFDRKLITFVKEAVILEMHHRSKIKKHTKSRLGSFTKAWVRDGTCGY